MIEAVFFDMDGVIIDSESFYFERRMTFLKEKNETPGTKGFRSYIGAGEEIIWELLIPEDEKKRNRLKVEYQIYRELHELDFQSSLINGFNEVLSFLGERSIKVAIVSSASMSQIEKLIDNCQLTDKIDFYLSGEEFVKSKPNPAIYNEAVMKSGILKSSILVVEDSEVGIEAGKEAGLIVAAMKSTQMNQQKADYHLTDHFDLINLIRKFNSD